MGKFSRRVFIKSSALTAGLASWPLGASAATAFAPGGLTPERRRTFAALVGTVAEADGAGADGPFLRSAGSSFDAWYSSAPVETRVLVERTLDGVESHARPGFSRMSRRRQMATLRRLRHARRQEERGLGYDAVVLASSPFGPSPYSDAGPVDI
jgi:hypothetical protein